MEEINIMQEPMESLGRVLTSIFSKPRRNRPDGAPEAILPTLSEPLLCQLCKGTAWISAGQPLQREYIPCACQRAEEVQVAKRIKWANLPDGLPHTFDNFEARTGTSDALEAARRFADRDSGYNILTLSGRNGSGKTHLLEAVGRTMLEAGYLVRYEYVPVLLDTLRAAYEEDAEVKFAERWAMYGRAQVLLLDDLGAERGSEWAIEKLTALVAERYRTGGMLVVATNLTFDQAAESLGYRIADRLWDERTGKVCSVTITAASYRTGRAWGVPRTGDRR
jgi:DNA replication protein DnaC